MNLIRVNVRCVSCNRPYWLESDLDGSNCMVKGIGTSAKLGMGRCICGTALSKENLPPRTTPQMPVDDPCYWMLEDGHETRPTTHNPNCYTCRDPEYAQMGLPLCRRCPVCGGHVAADDTRCDDCGANEQLWWESQECDDIAPESLAESLFLDANYKTVVPSDEQRMLLNRALEARAGARG